MMKIFSFIFFLSSLSNQAYGFSYFAFPHLNNNEIALSLQTGYISSEIEYEQNDLALSHYETKYLRTEISYQQGYAHDLSAKLEISAGAFGKLKKTHNQSLNLPDEQIRFNGIQGFEFFVQKLLPSSNYKTKYSVLVGTRGSLQTPKETNLAYGGFDFYMSLQWAHVHNEQYFYGNIKSEIIGRKKTKLISGATEVTDAYSSLGGQVGYLYEFFSVAPYFYHTTDYHTRNPNFNRITDKGFILGGEFKIFTKLRPNLEIYLTHLRDSYVFNIVDSSISGAIDYEIERKETYLGILWHF